MRKFFIVLLISIAAACCMAALSACASEEHVWSEEWKHNTVMHWHECTNAGCNERSAQASHDGFWELTDRIVHETCLERGWGVYTCTVCGQTKEDIIPDDGGHHFDGATWHITPEKHWRYCTGWGCNVVEESTHADDDTTVQKTIKTSIRMYDDTVIGFYCPDCNYLFHTEAIHSKYMPASFDVILTAQSSSYPFIPAKGELEEGVDAEYSFLQNQKCDFVFLNVKNDKGEALSLTTNYQHNELRHEDITGLVGQNPDQKAGFIVRCNGTEISNSWGVQSSKLNTGIKCDSISDGHGSSYYVKTLKMVSLGDYVVTFGYYAIDTELSENFLYTVKFHVLDQFDYNNAKKDSGLKSAAPSAICLAQNLDGVDLYLPVEKHEW